MNEHDVDQAGAYVLDALTAEERAEFERHLAGCATCREEVAQLSQVVAVLPLAADAVEPTPELRDRIVEAVRNDDTSRPALRSLPGSAPRRRMQFRVDRMAPLLTLAAAVVIAALGAWNLQLQQRLTHTNTQKSLAEAVVKAELDHPMVAVLPGSGPARGASARIIQPRHGHIAYVVVKGLPASPAGKVYQLWVMHAGAHAVPVSAGVYRSRAGDMQYWQMPRPEPGYTVAAFTVEPGPNGSKSPTSPPIMAGKFAPQIG